ncbi:MAG: hypothetical protein JNK56_38905, partial [Myxococcales bacterium]|nr:hypothetical protein [Myxococcales bacterium]
LCEAQIAAGLTTPWDDLPLPPVDPERRDVLMAKMPKIGEVRVRRRWLWPAIAGGSTLLAAGLAAFIVMRQTGPIEGTSPEVETLTAAARDAGVRAHWVWPPEQDPGDTSLRRVLQLEAMDGEFDALAEQRAKELRLEFATLLINLGDSYWDKDGGKAFARDYYLQAISFDPDNDHARSRTGATPGMLADFLDKATQGSFSEAEIRAAAPLIALAEPDEAKREEKLLALADDADEAGASGSANLDRLIASTSGKPRKRRPRRDDDSRTAQSTLTIVPPGQDPAVLPPPTDPSALPGVTPGKPGAPAVKRDTKQSSKLVKDAAKALAGGNRRDAEALYHQALGFDNRNAAALIGLSDLEFDKGAYQRAADYAEKATAAAPKNGAYHLRLGDAYYKLLRYTDARRAYEKAKELGVREATERLDKLKTKLGGK